MGILLFFPIAIFSQVNLDWRKIHFKSVMPDSLLERKVIERAWELEYLEKDTSCLAYDAATFFHVCSISDKDVKMDIYLFSFPTQSTHAPWGIAIRYMNDCFLFHYTHIAAAVWKIMDLIENRNYLYPSAISSIYKLLSCASDYGIEMMCEEKEDVRYCFYVANKNRIKRICDNSLLTDKCSPVKALHLICDKNLASNTRILQWLYEFYGRKFDYNAYKLCFIDGKALYLIESYNGLYKEYGFLFIEKGAYSFYQTRDLFIPLMRILKNFMGENIEGLVKSAKCLSLCCLYYY